MRNTPGIAAVMGWIYIQPIDPVTAIRLRAAVYHPNLCDWAPGFHMFDIEIAESLVARHGLHAGICNVAVLAVSLNHDAPNFGVLLGVNLGHGYCVRVLDYVARHGHSVNCPYGPSVGPSNRREIG